MSIYMTEEEQLESIKKWWVKHQSKITIVLSIILLCVAGYRYWNWHIEKRDKQASETYERLMVAFSKQDDQSIQAYAKTLSTEFGSTVYSDVARLTMARYYVTHERWKEATEALASVAQKSTMPALQQVAVIRLARIFISQKMYDNALIQLNKVSDTLYLSQVNELKGDIYGAQGEMAKAREFYQKARILADKQGVSSPSLEMKMNLDQSARI